MLRYLLNIFCLNFKILDCNKYSPLLSPKKAGPEIHGFDTSNFGQGKLQQQKIEMFAICLKIIPFLKWSGYQFNNSTTDLENKSQYI